MPAKKPAKKAPAKRKPRNAIVDSAPQIVELARRMEAERARIIAEMAAEEEAKKKPVDDSPFELSDFSEDTKKRLAEILDAKESPKPSSTLQLWLVRGCYVVLLCGSFLGGAWTTGGWNIGPKPIVRNDVLQQSYDADRASQAKILREYAAQGFVNDDAGRQKATDWFNANRFRNRGPDFRPYTSAVTDHFAAGTLEKFADELEGK